MMEQYTDAYLRSMWDKSISSDIPHKKLFVWDYIERDGGRAYIIVAKDWHELVELAEDYCTVSIEPVEDMRLIYEYD